MTRKGFLRLCLATGVADALGWRGWAAEPTEATLPPWRPGELELHFIYTGVGENLFYRLPDGTAIVNDVGEFYRPKDDADIPKLPSKERLGGDWVSRYIRRVYGETTIDYAIFSHWHPDHIGHAMFDEPESPKAAYRFRTTADGRRINGFLCVAEDFRFRRCLDHQYPHRGAYGSNDSSMHLLVPWIEREQRRGLIVEPFRVGALDQIALQRDPGRYGGVFSVRNVCANGKLWDGKDGFRDFAAEHVKATGDGYIPQNQLSMGFVIRYGKFRYWAGGDVQKSFRRADGSTVNYEALVGERVGKVTVAKMNHHGCDDAMCDGFVRAVRADAWVGCIWSPGQAFPPAMARMRTASGAASPLLLPNLVLPWHKEESVKRGYEIPSVGACHVVVKVAPGGDAYKVYLVDASDERMRVLATFDRTA